MSGVSVSVTVEDAEVRKGLSRLLAAAADLTAPLEEIGAMIEDRARERFIDQVGPDGKPWAPLSAAYQARRRKPGSPILTQEGHLRDSLTHLASAGMVQVGSNRVYAALHQLGGTSSMPPGPRSVPARPFLPVGDLPADERAEMGDILLRHLGDGL